MASNSTSSDRPSVSVDHQKAGEIARAAITGLGPERDLVIEQEKTIERPFGWVFFYTTRQYLLTGDKSSLMPGNGPLVVDRETGQHEFLSTSMPPSAAIDVYEKRWIEQRRDR